ncbi:DUF4132 domain-containing protein [Kitasatospora phosalacinea]|uniref:DUF4132 domain-containing protein n=1 Tax=Kitasatospora phosalacinea TaxID=2065 RepID=UPI0005245894|nr:DUF4132 domain-containing protein [Kitasatospora phosalacinea]
MRRWELVGGGSAKFWEAGADGASVRVRYGRIGTEGRLQVKELADAAAAGAHLAKLVAEKERKGYLAVGEGAPAAVAPVGTAPVADVPAVDVPAVDVPAVDVPAAAASVAPPALPDEDVFVLPEVWRPLVLPRRRGGVPVPLPGAWPVVDAAEVAALEARRVAERREAIEQVLTAPESEPGPVAAVRAYLGGAPDAAGLAAVSAMIRQPGERDWLEREFEGWRARFGLGTAVRAALASMEVNTEWVQPDRWRARLVALDLEGAGYHSVAHQFRLLAVARRALAAADGAEYASVLEELAQLRATTPLRRAVTAYLVPERPDWVDECLAEASVYGPRSAQVLRTLLLSALGSAEQVERFGPTDIRSYLHWDHQVVATLADGVGPAAGRLVAGALDWQTVGEAMRRYADYLAEFPTDEAMAGLVGRVTDKHVRPALLVAAERYPVRAVRVLSEAARRPGADARAARQFLNGQVAGLRSRLPELLPRLDEETAAFVLSLDGAREPLPEAGPELLPALLVDPPWERARSAREPRTLTGATADDGPELHWLEGELERFADDSARRWEFPADIDWVAVANRARSEPSVWQRCRVLAQGPAEVVAPLLESWHPQALVDGDESLLRPVLAKYGTAALRLLHGPALARPAQTAPVLLPVRDATVAGVMADALLRLKSVQPVARSWFARHGVAGALLLVPAAVGKAGRARSAAENALRLVAAEQGARALLAAVAERHGDEVAGAVADVLGADPLEAALPPKLPAFPAWLRVGALPQVLLADGGGALPQPAVRNLVTMLQVGKVHEPYPGLAAVAPALRADTLTAFAWAVFEEWWQAGMPSPDGWALHALGVLGDDGTARRLAPMVREWPGQSAHQRAVEGLEVLAAIGTDTALVQLHGIAQRVKFKALKARAQEKIAEIAGTLGLTAEQLADRLVPDLGLDADGSTVVDYGSRTFTVGFDEQLRPYVRDQDGKRRKDLPAPGAKDDPELAPAERKRFAALKKDVRALAADRITRLETAMVTERTWSAGEFTELLLGHPLLVHLVRRLVWTADGTAFRVAEDNTLADLDDKAYALPGDATVRLPHPLRLGADLAAWAELFADYEIVQPFPQLSRPVAAFTEEEAGGHRLRRFEGHTVPVGRLLGMTGRGWLRGQPQDAGVERWFHKPLPDGRHLVLALDPGIAVGMVNEFGEQTFTTVWLDDAPGDYWPNRRRSRGPLADLDAVTASELLRELQELTAH